MERFVVWKCNLFGRQFDVASFLLWFKELDNVCKESFVYSVLRRYGELSEQFYFVVQAFVFYVMLRYGLYWDEDVFQEAFLSIYEKVKYWDKSKGSLLSFLHSLIRDKVSQKKYDTLKMLVGFKELEDSVLCEGLMEEGRDTDNLLDHSDNTLLRMFLTELANKITKSAREEVIESILGGIDTIYRRAVLWESLYW